MVTRVPIDHKMARWARERCNLNEEEAAALLKCEVTTVQQIETGTLKPSASLFRSMANKYMLPEATLLGTIPDFDRPLPKDFRSFEGAPVKLTYTTIKAIRAVQERQAALYSLSEINDKIQPPILTKLSLESDPELEGTRYRETFGFDIPTQLEITPAKAFIRWRGLVEQLGISVYVKPFGDDDSRGVSDIFQGFPAIIIDQNEKLPGARLFTLFHELAHHFIRQVGISNLKYGNKVELYCNRFAAAFLMPEKAVKQVLPNAGPNLRVPEIFELENAATRLCVTISQIALRIEELGYVPYGYYRGVKTQLGITKKSKGGPEYRYIYVSEYGENFPKHVLNSLDAELISSVEASRAMNISPAHFMEIRRTLDERRAVNADA